MSLLDNNLIQNGLSAIKGNPVTTALGVGGVVLGGGLVTSAIVKAKRKKSVKRKSTRKKAVTRRTRTIKRKSRRTPRTAGKGKDRSNKRIRYTKKGQPYIIMASGKARFIKKSSAKSSHKLKGGRY